MQYYFDTLNRLSYLYEPQKSTLGFSARFEYDSRGNRDKLNYFLTGDKGGRTLTLDYDYDLDNRLIGYQSSGTSFGTDPIPTFNFSNVVVDGLSRLVSGDEELSLVSSNTTTRTHSLSYNYDERSQLTSASITNVGGSTWSGSYSWDDAGNIQTRTINSTPTSFSYNGDLMTDAGSSVLDHDRNGNMTDTDNATLVYNWDNRLRSASFSSDSADFKYDFAGNRVYKETDINSVVTQRKFILDHTTSPPTILLELDPANNDTIVESYLHAGIETLLQYDGDMNGQNVDAYFYLHSRNNHVRLLVDDIGDVVNRYTYDPFGQKLGSETTETVGNPFRFIGGYFDEELLQYHFSARDYVPSLGIFTAYDPVRGKFEIPLSLHRHLYSVNNPVNRSDPTGLLPYRDEEWLGNRDVWYGRHFDHNQTREILNEAAAIVGDGFIAGPYAAFVDSMGLADNNERAGIYDLKNTYASFALDHEIIIQDSEFGNFLAGYTTIYNYGFLGDQGVRAGGHFYANSQYRAGETDSPLDEIESRYYISAGVLKAFDDRSGPRGLWQDFSFIRAKYTLQEYDYDRLTNVDLLGHEFGNITNQFIKFWNSDILH